MRGEYVDELFAVGIKDGVVKFESPDLSICMPLRLFRAQHAANGKALAEYDARVAEVVPMRRHC